MKTPILTVLLSFAIIQISFSQPGLPEFGKVTPAELLQKECSFEKTASAYYLVNAATVEFKLYDDGMSRVITQRRVRIKIIDQKGFDFASVSIPHIGTRKTSKINDIEAFIYTLDSNGAVVKKSIDKNDIFKSRAGRKVGLNTVRFTFPGLKPGCVIEYRYEHVENYKYDIDPWLLQNEIPVALSYYQISFPDFSIIDYRLAGQFPLDESEYKEWPIDSSKTTYKKTFLVKNIPSFRSEPLMSSLVDNLKRIEFSLTPRAGFLSILSSKLEAKWHFLNTRINLSAHFGRQYDIDIPGTKGIVDSAKALKSNHDKINLVYQAVKKQIAWDKTQSLYPEDILEVWKTKTGNSAEINMIILNLLRKAGIECYPVLISTRENGKPDNMFAHLSQFNGMDVIAIDSTDYFVLDGTQKNQSFLIPPLDIVNRNVFISFPTDYKWVNFNETRPLIKDSVYVSAKMDKEGNITGNAINTSFDLARSEQLSEENKSEKNSSDLLANDITDLKIDTSWMINKDNDTLPLIENMKFHYSLSNTNNFYFLNPYLFSSFRKNPFTDTLRVSDVDFGCNQQYIQVIKIDLPAEIDVESMPKSILIRTEDSSIMYSRRIYQRSKTVFIENEFKIKKSVFPAEEYSTVYAYFQKVYALLSEEVLLNKK